MNANLTSNRGTTQWLRRSGMLLGATALSALLMITTAQAGSRDRGHDRGRDEDDHRVVIKHVERHDTRGPDHAWVPPGHYAPRPVYRDVHPYRPAYRVPDRFVIPRLIAREQYGAYSPWYRGSVFFAPHHHVHTVYYFPVYTPAGLVLQPTYYCGTSLYSAGAYVSYTSPGFSISFGF